MGTRSRDIASRRAEDAKLLLIDYHARLRRDTRALRAFKALRKRGATDKQIRELRDQIGMIAVCYYIDMRETGPAQRNRRTKLAKLLVKAARDLEKHAESFGITLRTLCRELQDHHEPVTRGRGRDSAAANRAAFGNADWTLAAGLRIAAEMLLRPDVVDRWWQPRFERRLSIEAYAFRSIFLLVSEVIGPRTGTRPMTIVANLAGALLNQDVDTNVFQRDPLIEQYWPAKDYKKD